MITMTTKIQISSSTMTKIVLLTLIFFHAVLASAASDDECKPDGGADGHGHGHVAAEALKWKLVGLFLILVFGAIGICLPVVGKSHPALHPEGNTFFVVKAFAAGVILATAFIHILPDAFEDLTSPCLGEHPWGDFPFAGFAPMVLTIVTLMIDVTATGYFNKKAAMSCSNAPQDDEKGDTELTRHRVISHVLEVGVVVHSVLIGVSLGVSPDPGEIKTLAIALTFHQCFEGMGLGGSLARANFKVKSMLWMILIFALTTPVGIGVGIGIQNSYNPNSPTALAVGGILNAAASGILIYMSLVDLLAADLMDARFQNNTKLQLAAYTAILLGAGCMSVLAKWA